MLLALSAGPAAYVSAVKRTHVLLVIPASYFLLGEKKAKLRIVPALVMLAGVLMIGFSG